MNRPSWSFYHSLYSRGFDTKPENTECTFLSNAAKAIDLRKLHICKRYFIIHHKRSWWFSLYEIVAITTCVLNTEYNIPLWYNIPHRAARRTIYSKTKSRSAQKYTWYNFCTVFEHFVKRKSRIFCFNVDMTKKQWQPFYHFREGGGAKTS